MEGGVVVDLVPLVPLVSLVPLVHPVRCSAASIRPFGWIVGSTEWWECPIHD